MSSISKFVLIVLLPLIFGCDPLRNNPERIAVDCGLSKDSINSNNFIKLLSSQGVEFTESDARAIKAIYRPSNSDERLALAVTPRGCVMVPSEPGLVQVVDVRNGDSLTTEVNQDRKSAALLNYKLSSKQEFQASLACKDDGLFASRSLAQPLIVNFSGEPAGLDIRLDLFSMENNFIKTLYRKRMGEPQFRLPSSLTVENIPEGAYLLKVYGNHIAEGIDSKPRLINAEQTCRLTVLRGELKVGGIDASLTNRVFAPESILPWQTQSPLESLNVCVEPRTPGRAGLSESSECLPQSRCKDSTNFLTSSLVKTGSKSGIFDYYVFSENRAGDKSPLACQTIIVSENPPALKVSWKHEELKKEGSILRKPYAVLQAKIDVNHDLVEAKTLENNLTCKVDFEIKGKNLFSDKSVVCTEGLCKGKSLADFVPCGTDVSFTLVDALNQPMLLSSRLRLLVRANDGAGHISESQNSVWINKSAWTVDELSFSYNGANLSISSFLIDHTGDVVATFGSRAAVYKDGRWLDLDPENTTTDYIYQLSRTRNHQIQIARSKWLETGLKVDVFGYSAAKITKLTDIQDDNLIGRCDNFLMGPSDVPHCIGIKVNDIYRLVNGKWEHAAPPVSETDPLFEEVIYWRILADGRIAGISDATLLILDGKKWTLTNLELPDLQASYDLIEDFKGRLWFYSYKGPTNEGRNLHRLDGSRLIAYPALSRLTQTLNTIFHPLSSDGLKYFTVGLQRFNFSSDQWELLPYPSEQLENLKDTQSQMNDSGRTFEYLSNQGVFEEFNELIYWPMKNLGYSLGFLGQDIERFQNNLYFIDNTNITSKVLRRININFVSAFDSKMLEIDDSFAIGNRFGPQGETDLLFFDGTQVSIFADHIETKKSPAAFDGSLQVVQLDENRSCYSTFHGLWVYDYVKGSNVKLSDRGTEESHDCLMTKSGDVWWMNIKSRTVYAYNGEKPIALSSFQAEGQESLKFLRSFKNSDLTMLVTDQRVVFFQDNGEIKTTIPLKDFSNISENHKIQGAAFLSPNVVLISLEGSGRQFLHFLYDIPADTLKPATEYTAMVGHHPLGHVKSNRTATYILTPNTKAVVIEWKDGTWRKIGKLGDFAPLLKNKNVNPWWFAPDDYGHLWMITRSPYALLRVDIEFAP